MVDKECSGKPVGFRGLLQRRYRAFHVGWYGRQYRVGGFRCEGRGDLELASMDDRSAGAVRLRRGRRIDGSQSRSDQRPGSRRGGLLRPTLSMGTQRSLLRRRKERRFGRRRLPAGTGIDDRQSGSCIVGMDRRAVRRAGRHGSLCDGAPDDLPFQLAQRQQGLALHRRGRLVGQCREEDELRSMSRRLPGAGSGRMGQYLLVQRGRRAEQRRQVLYDGLRCEDLVPALRPSLGRQGRR